ncbi:MAG: hypothetical protein ACQEXB_14380 [Bacillota bacterium]
MSCCSPEYRKVVNEEERKVNEKGKDTLPLFVKIISLLIIAGALGIALI